MSVYATLLLQAASEAREYKNARGLRGPDALWVDGLALEMDRVAAITDVVAIKLFIETLAHRMADSGPLDESWCPSFFKALDAFQRHRKRQ